MISRSSSKCYRPLQQLYKTVYSPISGSTSSPINSTSEKYTTTNMTYGSFHYNNWAYMQKNRRVKQRCTQKKMNNPSKFKNYSTNDVCCPINCCNAVLSNNKIVSFYS